MVRCPPSLHSYEPLFILNFYSINQLIVEFANVGVARVPVPAPRAENIFAPPPTKTAEFKGEK